MAMKDDAFFVGVGVIVIIGAAWYMKSKLSSAAGAIGAAIADPNNPVNSAVNSAYQSLPGVSSGQTPGGDLFSLLHPSAATNLTPYQLGTPILGTPAQPFNVTGAGW